MITPLDFQAGKIDELSERARQSLDQSSEREVVLLKAPTGSGKTVMGGLAMRGIASDQQRELAFIWIAPYSLQHQSKESMDAISEGVFTLTDLTSEPRTSLGRNEMGFVNWSSVNSHGNKEEKRRANRLLKTNEQGTDLAAFCEKTRQAGRQIVLIIDESHHSAGTEAAAEFIDKVGPALVVEMSATPNSLTSVDPEHFEKIDVSTEQVRNAGLIKKRVLVNDGLEKQAEGQDLEAALLGAALARRKELAKRYAKAGSPVNPLLLIQLPDSGEGDQLLNWALEQLSERGLTIQNGKVGIWLDNQHTVQHGSPELFDIDGKLEVLIFKQAISLGWDCPRAQVLLKLRNLSKQESFEVQTIGRIMRMPERKHYEDELLNTGFVFTGHENYKAEAGITPPLDRPTNWKVSESAPKLKRRYLAPSQAVPLDTKQFASVAKDVLKRLGLKSSMTPGQARKKLKQQGYSLERDTASPVTGEILAEDQKPELDKSGRRFFERSETTQHRFDRLIETWFGPIEEPGDAREELYDLFMSVIGFKSFEETQSFFLANQNNLDQLVADALSGVTERTEREVDESEWIPAKTLRLNTRTKPEDGDDGGQSNAGLHEEVESEGCAYEPCLLREDRSDPERRFEEWLDSEGSSLVEWWMKNGEGDREHWSITYKLDGSEQNFFPDYLVMFKDGVLGAFETKGAGAFTNAADAPTNKAKLQALCDWADSDSGLEGGFVVLDKGPKLVSGIDDLDGEYLNAALNERHGD